MRQATLGGVGFERYGKTTRRAAFLVVMGQGGPGPPVCALIQPVYPKPGNGRPPIGLERMLLIYYFLQHWFNLSGPGVPLVGRPVLFALARALAEAWPGDVSRETLIARVFRARNADES